MTDNPDDITPLIEAFKTVINDVDDLSRAGLEGTPERAAKAMRFLTRGYIQTLDEVVNNALFPSDNPEMIVVQDIELYSLCEHHVLPFCRALPRGIHTQRQGHRLVEDRPDR